MIGQMVVCVRERVLDNRLKLGKIFTITKVVNPNISFYKYYKLVSDIGEEIGWLDSTHFMPLSEIRLERLQELGI